MTASDTIAPRPLTPEEIAYRLRLVQQDIEPWRQRAVRAMCLKPLSATMKDGILRVEPIEMDPEIRVLLDDVHRELQASLHRHGLTPYIIAP